MPDLDLAYSDRRPDPAELVRNAEKLRSALQELGYAQVSDKP